MNKDYFIKTRACECCGHYIDRLHILRFNQAGAPYIVRRYPSLGLMNWEDIKNYVRMNNLKIFTDRDRYLSLDAIDESVKYVRECADDYKKTRYWEFDKESIEIDEKTGDRYYKDDVKSCG